MVALAQPSALHMTARKSATQNAAEGAIQEQSHLVEINNQFIPGLTIYAAASVAMRQLGLQRMEYLLAAIVAIVISLCKGATFCSIQIKTLLWGRSWAKYL